MKILHVARSLDPSLGGVSRAISTLIVELKKNGIHNEIVTLDDLRSKHLTGFDCYLHGPGVTAWNYSSTLLPWLKSNICRFDVIIINGLWQYHCYAVRQAILYIRKKHPELTLPKLYIMPHGMLDPYFQLTADRKLKAIRNRLWWKMFESDVINMADGLLFTCETELLLARTTFKNYHPKQEFNIGLGIESPPEWTNGMSTAFSAVCSKVKKPYLLFLGRIDEKKGVDLLVKAYIHLHKKYEADADKLPDLLIAGPGLDTAYGKKILALVNSQPTVKTRIHLPGMLDGDVKWGAFYGCGALVLPSHQENFGIAVAEALACKKPVLISNQVNIWKEIEKCNGGIIAADTLEGTKLMLDKWINMGAEEKEKMGANALSVYQNNFTIDTVTGKLIKIMEQPGATSQGTVPAKAPSVFNSSKASGFTRLTDK